jgi:hypothetical protein
MNIRAEGLERPRPDVSDVLGLRFRKRYPQLDWLTRHSKVLMPFNRPAELRSGSSKVKQLPL